jgi:predicted histone-like DNA-binding protein
VKKSDVLAVLTEMSEVMNDQLQDSKRVRLTGIGTFKLAISCTGVDSLGDFNPTKNIKKVRVSFAPITKVDRSTNRRVKNFTAGTKMKEYGQYVKIKKPTDDGGDPNGGIVKP